MTTIRLTKQAGTKGNYHVILRQLIESPHVNPALTLYQTYQTESQPTQATVESILLTQQSCVSPLSMVKRNTKKQLPLRSASQTLLARPAASFHLGSNLPSTPLNLVLASLKT